jgi:hypothetical protein
MKNLQILLILSLILVLMPNHNSVDAAEFGPGDLVKIEGNTAVYYVAEPQFDGGNLTRYAFPNAQVYFSWYQDFSGVLTISAEDLSAMRLIGNITYRPGTRLVKVTTVPNVYAVGAKGLLRLIDSEAQAILLFGNDWADRVDDVPDVFWLNYHVGDPLLGSTLPNDTLVKQKGESDVFIIKNGNKRKLTGHAFDLNRFQGIHIIELDNLDQYPAGAAINQAEVYRLDAAQKTLAPEIEPPMVAQPEEELVGIWQKVKIATDAFSNFYDPALTSNGAGWGVVWSDVNEDAAGNIYFNRVSATGALQGETLVVNNSLGLGGMPDIVWNGEEYAVVFSDKAGSSLPAIYFARINSLGELLAAPIKISSASGNEIFPKIVWNGAGYAVTWVAANCSINCGIRFLLLDSVGKVQGSEFQVNDHSLTLKPTRPALASSGDGYGVVWQAPGNNLALSVIYFRNISNSGKKENKELNINQDLKWATHPSVAWNGNEYIVAFVRNVNELAGEAQIVRVSNIGIKADFPRVFNDQQTALGPVNIIWSGAEYGLSWTDNAQGAGLGSNIYFTNLTSLGADMNTDELISSDINRSQDSHASFGDGQWAMVWEEDSDAGRREIVLGFKTNE